MDFNKSMIGNMNKIITNGSDRLITSLDGKFIRTARNDMAGTLSIVTIDLITDLNLRKHRLGTYTLTAKTNAIRR